jgi:hypothetical protein
MSAAVIAVLLSSTLLTTWMALSAKRANQLAQSVARFLQDDLLVQDEFHPPGSGPSLMTVLDRAADKVGPRFAGEPLVEASIRSTLGATYASVYADGRSEAQFERALQIYEKQYGLRHRRTLEAMRQVVASKMRLDQYAEAERLGLRALAHGEQTLGDNDPQYLALATTVALVQLEQGTASQDRVRYLVDTQRRVLGPEHPTTLQSMWILASVAMNNNDLSQAGTLARTVLEVRRRTLGGRHSETHKALGLLQLIYTRAGKCGAAGPIRTPAVREIEEVVVASTHIRGPSSLEDMALQGRPSCGVDDPWSEDNLQRIAMRLQKQH